MRRRKRGDGPTALVVTSKELPVERTILRSFNSSRWSGALAASLVLASAAACSSPTTSGPMGAGAQPGTGGAGVGAGAGTAAVSGSGTGGTSGTLGMGGVRLRLLTQSEYLASIRVLFGDVKAQLELPDDSPVAGYISVGASRVTVNATAAAKYEAASRAITAEVFADATRWQTLVGCQPQPDLSDACVTTFVQGFGKRAFRRDLTDAETQTWVKVAKDAASLTTSASQGLATATSGLLQSPGFLYRAEKNDLDVASGRLKYDGSSMASRLSFLLTGGPPSAELAAAAAAGQLDTAEGVAAAAGPLLQSPALVERLASFFGEYSQAGLVLTSQKSQEMFPGFNDALRASMLQGTQLFLKNIVLAPGADVRSFWDSDQTFVDAALAPIYGVAAPASGFAQVKLGPEHGRVGILGQAAVIAGHSKPDHSSPTNRGVFILGSFLCQDAPPPPPGAITELPNDPTLTMRQRLEAHRANPSCAACHALFDPLGMGLEHIDSIGAYREKEGAGLTIDATGALDGVAFNGATELGAVLRNNARVATCMMRQFYRSANGRTDDGTDTKAIEEMSSMLAARNYVFRDLTAAFVASDAFRSAPATATENQ